MEPSTFDIGHTIRSFVYGILYSLPIGIAAAVLTFFVTQRNDPIYEATTTILLEPVNQSSSNSAMLGTPPLSIDAYQAILFSDQVLTRALTVLGVANPNQGRVEEVRGGTSVAYTSGFGDLLDISYASETPQTATRTANALAAALINWDAERARRNIERGVQTLEQQSSALDDSIESLRTMTDPASQEQLNSSLILRAQQQQEITYTRAFLTSVSGQLSLVQPADIPLEPIAPRPLRYAALAFIGVISLTLAVSLLFNALDTRIRSARDIVTVTGLPLSVSFDNIVNASADNDIALLRTSILNSGNVCEAVLLSSSEPLRATAWLAIRLAESFALETYQTLLVELDMTQPLLARSYGLTEKNTVGLSTHLSDPERYPIAKVHVGVDQSLAVLPVFESDRKIRGHAGRSFTQALERWRQHYEVVVILAPPVLAGPDALSVATACTHNVLLVNLRRARRGPLQQAVKRFSQVGAQNMSIVALKRDIRVRQLLGIS